MELLTGAGSGDRLRESPRAQVLVVVHSFGNQCWHLASSSISLYQNHIRSGTASLNLKSLVFYLVSAPWWGPLLLYAQQEKTKRHPCTWYVVLVKSLALSMDLSYPQALG